MSIKRSEKKGVLLVNLGSPDSPTEGDVRKYLREFLMDGRVLDAPWPIRFGIVNFAILPKRPRESAAAYRTIWTKEGSPLVVTSRNVQLKLQAKFKFPIELAMRYQNPSIEDALYKLSDLGVTHLFLIPMFPHYAMSSYESAVVRVRELVKESAPGMKLQVLPPYYNDQDYIAALAASAEPFLRKPFDHLLFSYHGIPERHIRKSDPTGCHCLRTPNCCDIPSPAHATCYRAQCFQTTRLLADKLKLPKEKYSLAFQSRLGKDPWLTPYTDKELERLGRGGVKRLKIICPAFVTDCLETIEEIGERGRETFLHAGGEDFEMIPCLNEHPAWIAALEKKIGAFAP